MNRQISTLQSTLMVSGLFLLLALTLGLTPAFAHGDAVLTVSPASASPGENITIAAEGVEVGETFTISLVGISYETILGEVTVGEDEDFHLEFTVPENVPAGNYQVQAISEEGETLATEFTVLEGASQSSTLVKPAQASAAPMDLERTRSAGVWIAILVGILISASAGWALVRGRD